MEKFSQPLILSLSVLAFFLWGQSSLAQSGDKTCKPKTITVSTEVLEYAALKKVTPVAPEGVRAGGTVRVQKDLNFDGTVTAAEAIDGPTDLREVSAQAAKQWRFKSGGETPPCPPRTTGVLKFDYSKNEGRAIQ
jgi:hypothetical protein